MAATAAQVKNLVQYSSANGFGLYRYDSLDAIATVDGLGYFNNSTHALNLAVGDLIDVMVWGTQVRAPGTISDVGRVVVMQVLANGDVDLSTDLTSYTPATGD
jgi:hypothetical protein